MSLINISNLSFAYLGGENIFNKINLKIDTDWKLGFVGRNGRGKTTFLRILAGYLEFSGSVTSNVAFDYFPPVIKDNKLACHQIAAQLYPLIEKWRLEKEISLLKLDLETLNRPFITLSGGEKTKLLLACAFINNDSFMLIDEPTNNLDSEARNAIRDYLSEKKGFILVSHDRLLLDDCTDHTLSLNKTNIEIIKGNFSTWLNEKENRDEREERENQQLKKDIKRLREAARVTATWSEQKENMKSVRMSGVKPDKGWVGHKAAKLMKRSKSIEKRKENAAEEKSKLLKNVETSAPLRLRPLPIGSGIIIALDNISIFYDEKIVYKNFDLTLNSGERIALTGINGCGKSSIIKLLMGFDIGYKGAVHKKGKLKISYIPQDASFLKGDLREYAFENGLDESFFKAILRKLGFERKEFENDMSSFSDGLKKKVLLSKSLCEEAHVYLWDEPLNFIDVITRGQIEEAVLASHATMIFTEHDAAFPLRVATKNVKM